MKMKAFITSFVCLLTITTGILPTSLPAQIIAAGGKHSLAICNNDSSVNAWGRNTEGQLGNGTTINSNIPAQVTALTAIVAIASGTGYHSIALKNNGTVWAWGHNFFGSAWQWYLHE